MYSNLLYLFSFYNYRCSAFKCVFSFFLLLLFCCYQKNYKIQKSNIKTKKKNNLNQPYKNFIINHLPNKYQQQLPINQTNKQPNQLTNSPINQNTLTHPPYMYVCTRICISPFDININNNNHHILLPARR